MKPSIEESVSDGRSTSHSENGARSGAVVASPHPFDKQALVSRVARRTRTRYARDFTPSMFDDLIKDGMIDGGMRVGNDGLSPLYEYGRKQHRRALQIVRLRSRGIVSRDQIRIMLFLKGYEDRPWTVRASLAAVYIANARKLLAPVRSTHANSRALIPPKHRAAMLTRMGRLDDSLDAAGLKITPDALIEMMRTAKQDALTPVAAPEVNLEFFAHPFADNSPLMKFAKPILAGLLDIGEASKDNGPEIDTIERLIRRASDNDLKNAKHFHGLLVAWGFGLAGILRLFGPIAGALAAALDRIAASVRDDPKWASLILVLGLRILTVDPGFGNSLSAIRNRTAKAR